ncbi:MAG: imidazolonepropionase [Elusimicrobiota bacterium]
MNILITNITQLLTLSGPKRARIGNEMRNPGIIENAALYIEDEKIKFFGKERDVLDKIRNRKHINIRANGVVMPAFIDTHTHSVFARPRLEDFEMRTNGLSYLEIKKRGGGINLSARQIKNSSDDVLFDNLLYFSKKFIECGTTVIEVKSGYGLDFENEIKILNTIKKAKAYTKLDMIPTFLGAHSVPDGFKDSKEYLKYLKKEVLPYVAKNKLAVFADIFCEKGYFSVEESIDYLNFAKKFGLKPRIHAEQMSRFGGCVAAYKTKAISADHLDWADKSYVELLKKSKTTAVFLPASNYFTGAKKYPDARIFIDNGAKVVISTDFNPGTSPCWNMQFVISASVNYMKMKIEEAIYASTYNASCLLGLHKRVGMIESGMDADVIIMEVKDYREIAYYFGSNLNRMTIKRGNIIYEKGNSV